jgi:hypothetical protein
MSDAPPAPDFPEGWSLGADSWRFHRQFFARTGRCTDYLEYSELITQIRAKTAERLDQYHYRVTMRDGSTIIVAGGWRQLNGCEHANWVPKPKRVAKPVAAVIPEPAPPESPAIQTESPAIQTIPPPRRKLGLNTLTLGNPAGARALAARLQRMGVPLDAIGGISPP